MKRKVQISKPILYALVALLAIISFGYNFVSNLLYVGKESASGFEFKPVTAETKS